VDVRAAMGKRRSLREPHRGPRQLCGQPGALRLGFCSVFAPFGQLSAAEFRRVTEVSYLGFVHGTMAALNRMKARDRGTIVQVGSALGARSIPLQSAYCGAKHAINGFTSSLRCELMHEHSGINVTVVRMPAVNTPQFSWVRSRLPNHPQPVPPIYQPKSRLAGWSSPPITRAAGSTGSVRPPRRPSWLTGSCQRCWTGTWPGPAIPPSRRRST
jgi:NAD(P)-dependent dehydrogenase (short-subunit alcohol dehydrogenase family)